MYHLFRLEHGERHAIGSATTLDEAIVIARAKTTPNNILEIRDAQFDVVDHYTCVPMRQGVKMNNVNAAASVIANTLQRLVESDDADVVVDVFTEVARLLHYTLDTPVALSPLPEEMND